MFKRVNSDVVPFSINSPAGNRYVFGTADVSNDIDVNYNENIKKGFGTGPNEFPELEDFNALMFTGSYLAAYLYQAGIPEWNDKQKYYINSIVMGSDGNIYRSLAGTEESPNVNNNPTLAGSTSWKSILSDYALINGDETKRFKVADAVELNEAINKKQLDALKSSVNSDISNIQTLPIGAILNGFTIFDNCIVAFGGEFNRADYPKLWAYLQANPSLVKTQAQWTTEATANGGICGFFSSGNGTTTFRVPNLDKAFLRPDSRGVGSFQVDEFKSHSHGGGAYHYGYYLGTGGDNTLTLVTNTSSTGGTETRPKNIAVLPLIVAK
ncbi:hypothetical protein [Aliarcobacter cryaerophilus]|uniref:hypothetical protein n=1 Tax=Aliarcobacter cryaerophilus TaxID=28198 RepID=UPI000826958A|nr:hypothetical protein [Aliarcobacter cryaerophilus]